MLQRPGKKVDMPHLSFYTYIDDIQSGLHRDRTGHRDSDTGSVFSPPKPTTQYMKMTVAHALPQAFLETANSPKM